MYTIYVKIASQVYIMILANVNNFENNILVNLYETWPMPGLNLDCTSAIYFSHNAIILN